MEVLLADFLAMFLPVSRGLMLPVSRWQMVALVLSATLLPVSGQMVQDTQIYGKFEQAVIPIDAREKGQILAKCFWGLGFTSCRAALQDDDIIQQRNLPYYNTLPDNYGTNW